MHASLGITYQRMMNCLRRGLVGSSRETKDRHLPDAERNDQDLVNYASDKFSDDTNNSAMILITSYGTKPKNGTASFSLEAVI